MPKKRRVEPPGRERSAGPRRAARLLPPGGALAPRSRSAGGRAVPAGGPGPGRGRADAAQRPRSGPARRLQPRRRGAGSGSGGASPQPLSSRPLGAPPARPHLHSARPARRGLAEPRSAGAADWRARAQLICMGRGGAPGGAAAEKLSPSRRECPAERPAPRRGQETAGGGPPAAWR